MTAPTTHRPGTFAWRTVNISPAERAGRVLMGLAATIIAIVLLATAAGGALAVVLEALLLLAGLDLLVTGATGHCPLYAKLGHVPRTRRSPP
ncbi:YgaP-like transmembrane domain [Streptomyces asiaticus]